MDVLIKGMDLPKKGNMLMVAIFSDGSVDFKGRDEIKTHRTKAIELPEHGDLIDRKELLKHRFEVYDRNEEVCQDYVETYHILEAPVVLEAST